MKDVLIKNALIVNSDCSIAGDILVCGSNISRIDSTISSKGNEIILEADGLPVIPGGIDPHVHLALPTPAGNSSDDFITGSRAALHGGTTSLIDFVTPHKEESLLAALKNRKAEAVGCLTDISFHVGVTSWRDNTAGEMRKCVEEEGVVSFKVYLAYLETIGIEYQELGLIMETAASIGAIVAVHCEDGAAIATNQANFRRDGKLAPGFHALSRPSALEVKAIEKVIELSAQTGCRVYIVHVSCKQSVALIAAAKRRGVNIEAETCPHYLLFDESVYKQPDYEELPFIISPPIRSKTDQDTLWTAISDGTIKVVSTDHCPFNLKGQKDIGTADFTKVPNGTGSIEDRLSLLYTYGVLQHRITINQWVDLCSSQAARIFGMSSHKGRISEGMASDLVIWQTRQIKTVKASEQMQRCDHTIYEGFELMGFPGTVIRRGLICD